MSDEEMLEAVAHTRYEWDCPECQQVNTEESDPAGDTVQCSDCGIDVHITETR